MKSRVKGDFQARFRENVGVKFPCVTRLVAMSGQPQSTGITRHRKNKKIPTHKEIFANTQMAHLVFPDTQAHASKNQKSHFLPSQTI